MKALIPAIAALLIAGSAQAQQNAPQCRPMSEWREGLLSDYGEVEIRTAISQRGFLAHYFVEPTGATYTVIAEAPGSGQGCIIDAGTDWTQPQAVEDEGSGV